MHASYDFWLVGTLHPIDERQDFIFGFLLGVAPMIVMFLCIQAIFVPLR